MNDTVNLKAILPAQIGASQLEASARAFPRVVGSDPKRYYRRNSAKGSLSPTDLTIAHQPRSKPEGTDNTIASVTQTLQRVDTLSNPVSRDDVACKFSMSFTQGVSLAEFREAAYSLLGFLTEANGANLDALYNKEF